MREQYKSTNISSACRVYSKTAQIKVYLRYCVSQVQLNIFFYLVLCTKQEHQHLYNLPSITCTLNSQLNHALYRLLSSCSEVLVERINLQWHAADRAKEPRSTSSPAHEPFKSLPPSVPFFPKCNYKPGEGGYCGLGSLKSTASTPALGGIKRPGSPCKAPPHLTALQNVSSPSNTRLTSCFQHRWILRFSPQADRTGLTDKD